MLTYGSVCSGIEAASALAMAQSAGYKQGKKVTLNHD